MVRTGGRFGALARSKRLVTLVASSNSGGGGGGVFALVLSVWGLLGFFRLSDWTDVARTGEQEEEGRGEKCGPDGHAFP